MIEADLLVIGSGFAGLWAAVTARDAGVERVAVVDKGAIAMSSQSKLSAGATVYCLPDDDLDEWVREYAEAQGFLSRQEMLTDILATSGRRLAKLEGWGVSYEKMRGTDEFVRLPSRGFKKVKMMVLPKWRKRVGGSAVVAALRHQLIRRQVSRHPHYLVTSLLQAEGRIAGALGVHRWTGETELFRAPAIVLAAADCSFRGNYACADAITGDAFRLAYDAGARLSNMEFLCVNTGSPRYGFEGTGIALRFGGKLVDKDGEAFMSRYHPEGDAAEVGHLVRAMAREAEAGHGPPFYLDMTGAGGTSFVKMALSSMGGFMPLNIERLAEEGNDIFETPQEWLPAIHSLRGGVRTGVDCESDIPGLFAAGLSQAVDPCLFNGWSSMRAMWAGERAGGAAAKSLATLGSAPPLDSAATEEARRAAAAPAGIPAPGASKPDVVLEALQQAIFPAKVSILKTWESLGAALSAIEELRDRALPAMRADDPHELAKAHETANMVAVAEMFLRASLAREESRTDHYRTDFPEMDNERWLRWINIRRDGSGGMALETEEVPLERYAFGPSAPAQSGGAEHGLGEHGSSARGASGGGVAP